MLRQELHQDEVILLKAVNVACLRHFARFAKRFPFARATATMFQGIDAMMHFRYGKGQKLLALATTLAHAHCKGSTLLIGLCHLQQGRLSAVPWKVFSCLAQSDANVAPIGLLQPAAAGVAASDPSAADKGAPPELRKQGTFHGLQVPGTSTNSTQPHKHASLPCGVVLCVQAFQGSDLVPRLVLDFGGHELGVKSLRGCVALVRFAWRTMRHEALTVESLKLRTFGSTLFAPIVETCSEFGGHILQLSARQLVVLFLSDGLDTEHFRDAAHAAALCCLNIDHRLGSSQARFVPSLGLKVECSATVLISTRIEALRHLCTHCTACSHRACEDRVAARRASFVLGVVHSTSLGCLFPYLNYDLSNSGKYLESTCCYLRRISGSGLRLGYNVHTGQRSAAIETSIRVLRVIGLD